jgi:hypothetical protein
MPSLATRRLIDAAATLEAADRALLNLWVNRGFDNDRLAALSRMPRDTLDVRRERIVEHLSEELGLPPDHVNEALEELAASARETITAGLNGVGAAQGSGTEVVNGAALPVMAGLLLGPAAARAGALTPPPAPADPLTPPPAPADPLTPPPAPAASRRGLRRPVLWLVVGLFVLAVGVLVAALASGGGPTRHPAITAVSTPSTAPAVNPTSPSPTPAPPTRTAGGPVTTAGLGGLPGGLAHARGVVQLVGPMKHLRLRVTVRGLPAPVRGHYEVWLFNSVLNSRALGRLRAGVRRATYRLPAGARRYRWIDVSFQPLGVVNHSGESELRAINPAHATKARLRRRAARRPRQLRRATSGSRNAKTSK